MNYKLIAVDLDGTLYNDEPAISPATIQALIKAQEMGIRVAISSGRPLPGLFHARDALNLKNIMVCLFPTMAEKLLILQITRLYMKMQFLMSLLLKF